VIVKDAAKQTGRLHRVGRARRTADGGQPYRVDIKKASEEGIKQTGVLIFDISAYWEIVLKTEVMGRR